MRLAIATLALIASSCGQVRQYENYGVQSVADLTLTSSNHPHGYGRSQCFLCHVPANLHQVDRLGHPSFDLARDLVAQSGVGSCAGCHGSNGVSP